MQRLVDDDQELQTLRPERSLGALRGAGGDRLVTAQLREVLICQTLHRTHRKVWFRSDQDMNPSPQEPRWFPLGLVRSSSQAQVAR